MKNRSEWRGGLPSLVVAGLCFLGVVAFGASSGEDQLAAGNNRFAFNLLRALEKERPGENVFISPYSVSAALQIVCNGAEGETRKEMGEVLGTAGMASNAASEAYRQISASLRSAATNATLTIANAIWFSPQIQLKPEFVSASQNYFQAKIDSLDFTDPRSPGVVNRWVAENTRGKIEKIVEGGQLSGMTGAFIANAIYFKGTWEKKFDSKLTQSRTFHAGGDNTKLVPMMHQGGEFLYVETAGFQAARLPYGGGRLVMYLFLPATNSSVSKLVEEMTGDGWAKSLTSFRKREGKVGVPRFKLEFGGELKKPLSELGMKRAFRSGAAEFGGISTTPLYISAVRHKTFVEVNEEGTEAAAVTGVAMAMTAMRPVEKPFELILDRPFLFLIEDAGEILFAGVLKDVP
jgi:serine protease inhibitor